MERLGEVDVLRGIAIVLMVIYHFFFDVYLFGLADIDLYGLPLILFQRLIGTLFLLLVGVSIVLSESVTRKDIFIMSNGLPNLGLWLS